MSVEHLSAYDLLSDAQKTQWDVWKAAVSAHKAAVDEYGVESEEAADAGKVEFEAWEVLLQNV